MKTKACFPFAVYSSEIDGRFACADQFCPAIKECDSNVASTILPVSVVVPGVHLTLWCGADCSLTINETLPRAISTENSGQSLNVNQKLIAAAQE